MKKNYRFIHIPKCGGSTFKVNFINKGIHFPMDHLTCFKEGDKHITILRNPIDQVMSRFRSQTETIDEPFVNWFEKESTHNMQTKHLKLRVLNNDPTFKYVCPITEIEVNNIIQILKKEFYKVMVTEKLNRQMPLLLKKMKVPLSEKHCNRSKKQYKPTTEEKNLIREKCALDFKLYNAFK